MALFAEICRECVASSLFIKHRLYLDENKFVINKVNTNIYIYNIYFLLYFFFALYIITNVNAPLLLYYVLPMYQEYEIKIINNIY